MFRCAIIGCGNIGGGYDRKIPTEWSLTHAGAYHLCPETELVAAADASHIALESFGEKWGISSLYKDYEEMLNSESIEILSLCLPTEKHFHAFKSACEKNIPAIFCEKPLSYEIDEAKEMARISEGRVVAVNYFRRWNLTINQLRKELNRGVYGRILNITARYTKGIFVNGSHLVDLIRWFFGEPEEIHPIGINTQDAEDPGVDFCLTYKDRFTVYFFNIPDVEYTFLDIDILTEKGRIVLDQRGQSIEKSSIIPESHFQNFNIIKRIETIETEWRHCLAHAVKEIVDCLKNDRQTSCTAVDGLHTVDICHKAILKD